MAFSSLAFKPARNALIVCTLLGLSLGLSACGGKKQAGAQAQMPDPVVSVVTVQPQTVRINTELSGRLLPIREAKVTAQATGIIRKRLFTEGGYVKAGQPLFQIDNAPYVAALDTAKAQLLTAQANLAKADADVARYRPLVEANAISKQEFDAAIAQQRLARAQTESARAAIKSAQINVGYAFVTAPISGKIGKALVTEGSLVSQAQGSQLAVIQQTDTLYVDLSQSAESMLKLRQAIASGKMQAINGKVAVSIKLNDGTLYPQEGRLLFTDPTVDEATGQVSLRAEIPNEGHLLMPGMYVRVEIPQAQIDNAVLVPQQAVTRGTSGDTVMLANADGTFAPRPITISQQEGNSWVVTGGLKPGEQVIVDGMSVVQMTQAKKVKTQPWQAASGPVAPASQPVAASQPASAVQAASQASAAASAP